MDVEKDPVNGGAAAAASGQQKPPAPPHTNSFTVPLSNGTDASTNGAATSADEAVPAPPPHRSSPSSPVQSEAEQAESFKNDGNKFFKAGDYKHAIEFYTKGGSPTNTETQFFSVEMRV